MLLPNRFLRHNTPMKGNLLWVYEGLTEYLGGVPAARSGLWKADDNGAQWPGASLALMAGT